MRKEFDINPSAVLKMAHEMKAIYDKDKNHMTRAERDLYSGKPLRNYNNDLSNIKFEELKKQADQMKIY